VWGNHSPTMYADYRFATVNGKSVKDLINDQEWNANTFLPTVGKRGAAIIEARGLSSAASAANAAIDHMRDWALGTNGKWVTMGMPSDGQYGIPKDVMFGFPVTTENGEYKVVEGLEIDAFSQERIDKTLKELQDEQAAWRTCSDDRRVSQHPRDILLGAQARTGQLPVCDHYSGVEARMRKSLQLQAEMTQEFGACVFDVTLDCEDGAPVGGEPNTPRWSCRTGAGRRARRPRRRARAPGRPSVVRKPTSPPSPARPASACATSCCPRSNRSPTSSPPRAPSMPPAPAAAAAGADRVARRRAPRLRHRRAPARAVAQLRPDGFRVGPRRRDPGRRHGRAGPVHASAGGARQAGDRFGLPCARQGALALRGHRVQGQAAMQAAASRAANEFGYTRMWSIHPDQIRVPS
jgi:hypothetical protein